MATRAAPASASPSARLAAALQAHGIHYGWLIVGVTFLTLLGSAAVRSMPGVLIQPFESEFGWDRASITVAVSISLLMFGVMGPIAGRMMDRAGPRTVAMGAVGLLLLGALGTTVMTQVWQLDLLWGFVVGAGAGSMGMVLVASVANRWFEDRRGLVTGILGTATSTGQILFVPLVMLLAVQAGWRVGVLAAVALLGLLVLPLLWLVFRNDPQEVGLQPFGAAQDARGRAAQAADRARSTPMSQVIRTPDFWWLAVSFWVCGYTTNGLIGTHFIPHATEHGVEAVTAAGIFGIMGGVNILGTIASGMLVDRIRQRRVLLAALYGFRGLSLFILPFVNDATSLMVFGVLYGLNWFATAPVSQVLTADIFGRRSVGQVYGWIFLAHQIGAATASTIGGLAYVWFGDYQVAFISAGFAGLMAAGFSLQIRDERPAPAPMAVSA